MIGKYVALDDSIRFISFLATDHETSRPLMFPLLEYDVLILHDYEAPLQMQSTKERANKTAMREEAI